MKSPVRLSAAVGAALLLLAGAAPSPAPAQDRPRGEAGAPGQMPLSRVLQILAQKMPGRQLNTTMGNTGGRPTYVIQWQKSDGRVVVVVVDAETGQIIG
jgi:uncharacterized membrane protein YkoI